MDGTSSDLSQLGMSDDDIRQRYPLIARPAPAAEPVAVRGLTPPTSSGEVTPPPLSVAGPSSAAAPNLPEAKPAIPRLSSLGQQTERDRATETQLAKGSGISQIRNPWARGALRGLNIAGEVGAALVPELHPILGAIPGTEEHHQQLLGRNQQALTADEEQAAKQAQTEEAGARTAQAQSEAEKNRAAIAAENQPKPKEEKWGAFTGYTDTDGTPLIHEENSGQVVRADTHQPPKGFQVTAPKAGERPDTPEQQFIDEYQRLHPKATVAQAVNAYTLATQRPPEQLLVVPGATPGEQRVIVAKPGMTIAQNAEKPGEAAAASRKDITAHDKAYVQPAEAVEKSYEMMDNAFREYEAARAQGKELPTGAQSMLALSTHLTTTFGNVKGARITKDMIEHHLGARSISDAAQVAIQRLTNGDVLSPDQWKAFHDLIGESRKLSWQTAVREAERKHIPVDFLPPDLTEAQLSPPKAPAVGTIENGYKFKGGDPAQQSSWEKVPEKKAAAQ